MRWGRTQTRTVPKSVSRQQQRANLGTAAIDSPRQQQTRVEDRALIWPKSQLAQHVTTSLQNPLQSAQGHWPSQPHGQLHCKIAQYQLSTSEHDDTDDGICSAALLGRQRLAQTQHRRARRRSFHRQAKASALDPNKAYPHMDQSNGKNISRSGGYQTPQKRQRTEPKDSPIESDR
jgi:hypothetical protein